MEATTLLERVLDPTLAVSERFAAGTRLRGLLDATLLSLSAQMSTAGDGAAGVLQDTGRLGGRSIAREMRRADVVQRVPSLGDALGDGDVSVDHVDVFDRALQRLEPAQRDELLTSAPLLVDIARTETPERFDKIIQEKVARLLTDRDRAARLAQQQRDTRLRTWVDRTTGMWNIRAEYDPVTGQRLQILIDARHDTLFASTVPDTAPDDPLERAQHLRALALVDLVDTPGRGTRPEVVVTLRPEAASGGTSSGTTAIDWRLPIEVPRSVLEHLVTDPATTITPIVVAGDLVLHAPGQLNLGRSTRIANRAQRRALHAVHSTCAIPDCDVPFHRCEVHHIVWWRHGGTTDLVNLVPLCGRHHTQVHLGLLDLPPPIIRVA
jgi:hypothetical protein